MEKNPNKISIGIDLGTTFSVIGVWKNNNVKIIPTEEGDRTLPSMVAFLDENERLIGEKAKSKIGTKDVPIIYDSKRLIGRKKDDPELIKDRSNWPFTIITDKDDKIKIEVDVISKEKKEINNKNYNNILKDAGKVEPEKTNHKSFERKHYQTVKQSYYPEQISAMILKNLKENAENYLKGEKITSAVITVPAYFNDSQRTCTKQAAEIAGLKVKRIINEPTAAVLAYGLNKTEECEDKKIIVFDLGGGTLDVTLLNLDVEKCDENDFEKTIEVIGVNGDTHLGGQDFDQRILNKCKEKFYQDYNHELNNQKALVRLKRICENAKIQLSSKNECEIFVPKILLNKDLKLNLTRKDFEDMCKDLFDKCIQCIDKTIEDAKNKDRKFKKEDISDIILIGGSTRIPKIKEMLAAYFNKAEIHHTIDPDEAVAIGATIQSAILDRVKEKKIEKINLLDVCPLSLGTNVKGGKMDVIIKKNSKIPIKKKAKYSTAKDYQTKIKNFIYEGEHELTKDNYFLGDFSISNIQPRKKGESKIEITYYVDGDSILTATAVDLTNPENSSNLVVINDRGNFTKEELEKLKEIENDYDNYKNKLNNNELRNFKKDIIHFKEIINDDNKKNEEKYEAHKNLCLCFEKFLTTFDLSKIKENQTTLEKLVIYLKLCFNEFSKLLSFDESTSEEDKEKMILTIKKFLPLIVDSQKYNIYEVIEDLKDYEEIYKVCLIFAIKYSFLKGQNEYNKNNLIKSLDYMDDAKLTANSNNIKDYLMEKKNNDINKEYLNILEHIQKYIKKINIRKLIEEGDKLFKEGFKNNLIFDIHKLFEASDKYIESLQINYEEKDNTKSQEIDQDGNEAKGKVFDEELKNLSQQKLSEIIEKKFSEIKEVKEYINDYKNMVNDIKKNKDLILVGNEDPLNNLDINEFEQKYKQEHPEIFNEINKKYKEIGNHFETKSINFIKFLLNKYPPKNYNNSIDVEKEFKKNPSKLMKKLATKYQSDHIDNETIEEKKKYIIIKEIEVLITTLWESINEKLNN